MLGESEEKKHFFARYRAILGNIIIKLDYLE